MQLESVFTMVCGMYKYIKVILKYFLKITNQEEIFTTKQRNIIIYEILDE